LNLNPDGIAVGPDAALWFTNYVGGSIGRITAAGAVSNYTDPSVSALDAIAAGPDGAMWFTNVNNSIGRITTP
jgi:virginiamycin B lyase